MRDLGGRERFNFDLGYFTVTEVVQHSNAADADFYGPFFVATRKCEVVAISEVHNTAAGAAATVMVERLQSTETKGNGDDLLSSAFDLNGVAAETVTAGTLTGGSVMQLSTGDRLGLDEGGNVAGTDHVTITVELRYLES